MNLKSIYKRILVEKAYHGSRHYISDKFDLEKIDTGQGAQTYGWGLYFAENEKTASSYRYAGADKYGLTSTMEGVDFLSPKEAKEFFDNNNYVYAKDLHGEWVKLRSRESIDHYLENLSGAQFAKKIKKRGYLYEVEIYVTEDELLDWDKPLDDQSDFVKKTLKSAVDYFRSYKWKEFDDYGRVIDPKGNVSNDIIAFSKDQLHEAQYGPASSFYHFLSRYSSDKNPYKEASLALLNNGIKGIKFLDQHSRNKISKKPTRNFVIFDSSLVSIKKRSS